MENPETKNKNGMEFFFCGLVPKDDKRGRMHCINKCEPNKVIEFDYMRVVDGKNCR